MSRRSIVPRRCIVCFVVLAALSGSAPASRAENSVTYPWKDVWRARVLSTDPGWPRAGTRQVRVGVANLHRAGRQVARGRTTITAHPFRHTWTYRTVRRSYTPENPAETLLVVIYGKFTIRHGWVDDQGRGRIVRGTRYFKGVTCRFRVSGRNRVGAPVFKYTARGSATWPGS